jgi:aminoglycoside/choline kinase family phosphotransferase
MSLLQNLTSDTRLALLVTWLRGLNVVDVDSLRPASADASFRRYFRVNVLPEQQAALGPP